ncbi:hypothetical protein HZB78_00860 [Candidatus Collierbacteria bacterium]|nr:hypothetical protein [Candidatus Collierbacteria bacterium]
MEFVSGTDKNLAFRFTDHSSWYDIHFVTNDTSKSTEIVLQRVFNTDKYSNRVTVQNMYNGNTYNIGIEILGEHIKIFVDNNLVLDYPDAGARFPTGGIALQASAGGDPHSEVYFDNVVVSSIDAEPTPTATPVSPTPTPTPAFEPIVVIPGMLGSWCKDAITNGTDCPSSWIALPEPLNPYDSLISSVINAPDIPDSDVFVWYYDWRKPITDLASQLNTYINSTALSGKPAGTKVKLVGHSYGGLVASKYLEDNSAKVGKLITVGSPHKGAAMAYGAWEGGEIWDFPVWQRIPLQILLNARAGLFQTSKDTIRNDFKSVKEILPTFDYLTNQSNQTISESTMSQRNSQLPNQYSGLTSIKSLLATITGLENSSSDTLLSIKTTPRNWMEKALGLWEDGKPTQFIRSAEGDLTVLRSSGRYDEASSKPEITADHEGLISGTAGINQILQSLGSSATAAITSNNPDGNSGLAVFFLRSPAAISVNFNGTNYSDSDNDGLIAIENVVSGQAAVTLTGTGNGAYHLDVLQFHPNGDTAYTYAGTITAGSVQTLNFNLNPANPDNLTPAEDITGEIYLSQAINLATETNDKITASSGRARAKNLLSIQNQDIKRIIQSAKQNIANPANSLKYIQEAILKLHRLRRDINTGENASQLSSTDATKIRKLTEDSVERLQSAFKIVSIRASKNYSARQISDLSNIASKAQTKTDLKASTATKGLVVAAPAALAGQNDILEASDSDTPNQAAYINYVSSRLYFEEAMEIMR